MFIHANIFQPLIDVLEDVMVFIHDNVVSSWGLSIILLTVVTRVLLLPLTLKQFKSMQALAHLQPEIKRLQEKYKDDKQRLNQEMMKFYQENKVNPLGSCLPLLAQMPVFLALFYMLRIDLKRDICPGISQQAAEIGKKVEKIACGDVPDKYYRATDEAFLFIPDLTEKATGGVLIALIVLYIGSQLVSSLLMMVSADPMQKRLMLALPFIFVIFIISFPAGLIVYWITTNVWTIGQQWIVKRLIGPMRPETDADSAVAVAGLPSGGGGAGRGSKKPTAKAGKSGSDSAAAAPTRKPSSPPQRRSKKKRTGRRR